MVNVSHALNHSANRLVLLKLCYLGTLYDIAVTDGSQLRARWRRGGTQLGNGRTRKPPCEGDASGGANQAVVYTVETGWGGERPHTVIPTARREGNYPARGDVEYTPVYAIEQFVCTICIMPYSFLEVLHWH